MRTLLLAIPTVLLFVCTACEYERDECGYCTDDGTCADGLVCDEGYNECRTPDDVGKSRVCGNGGGGGGGGDGGGFITCNDGTRSPGCTTCSSGCCSGHGGCL